MRTAREQVTFDSRYVVMARQMRDVQQLDWDPNWREVPPDPSLKVWTDQYTNIFRVIKWPWLRATRRE